MKQSATRKFETLDVGRGLAALAVTFHHATQAPFLQRDPALAHALEGLSLGVAYFFVLSGTVIVLAHWQHLGMPSYAITYLKKRARRIYPLYWVAVLAWLLFALRRLPPAWALTDGAILLRFFPDDYKFFPPSWTLYHEISFYMVFLAAILHRRIGGLVLALWWIAALLCCRNSFVDFAAYPSSVQLLFGMGAFAGWMVVTGRRIPSPRVLVLAGAGGFVALAVLCGVSLPMLQPVYLAAGIAACLLILGSMELERQERLRMPSFLLYLGRASYAIYLFHPMFQSGASTALRHISCGDAIPDWGYLCAIVATSVACACAVHQWIERPMMRWIAGRASQ